MIPSKGLEATARRYAPAIIGLLGLVLLTLAGRPLTRQVLPFWAAVALLYGVIFWLLLGRYADEGEAPDVLAAPAGPPRVVPLLVALSLAVAAWQYTGGNRFQAPGVIGWIGSVAVWAWAWAPRKPRDADRRSARSGLPAGVLATLVLIVAVGAFVYFHRLAETPGEPTSDHAETLLDLTDVLHGDRPIFFTRNTGREPWKFYWLFALVEVFGLPPNFLTTKVGTVTTALLAIPAMFVLGRELGGNRLGLFAALLLTWSQWPLAMARVGIRISYAILPTAMVLWALLRYLRRGDRGSALWAGFWLGIGWYGYVPFRVVPLLVPLAAALALIDPRWRSHRQRLLVDLPLIAATAALVFLPLLHFMFEYPQFFWERIAERSTLSQALGREIPSTLLHNLRNMALAFHVRGDGGWVNFPTREPFLDVVTGALFLAGLLLALSRIFRGSIRWAVPTAGMLILTLPSVLVLTFTHENPSVNRAVAAVPVVFVLAATPLDRLVRWLSPLRLPVRIAGYAAIAALLVISVRESYRVYFVKYHAGYSRLVEHTVEMAREIRTWIARGNPPSNAYVLNAAHWLDPRNIGFELGDPGWAAAQEVPPDVAPPLLEKRPLLFLLGPSDVSRRAALRQLYPEGRERLVSQSHPDRNFFIYVVP